MNERGFMIEYVLLYWGFVIFLIVLSALTGTIIPSLVLLALVLAAVYWPHDHQG